jgi:SPP1 family predicted phage head-tail adaptor
MKYNKNEIIGRMRDRITIQNVTRSKSDTGFAQESWADSAIVWANAESKLPPSNETVIDGKNTAKNISDFTIRYTTGIDEESRIIWNDKLYQVRNIKVSHDRRFISFQGEFYDSYILTGVSVASILSANANVSSNIKVIHNVLAAMNAIATTNAELTVSQQGQVLLDSSLSASGNISADATKVIKINSDVTANGTLAAAVTKAINIDSTLNANATLVGDALVSKTLSSTLNANATTSAAVDVVTQGLVNVDASLTGLGTVAAELFRTVTLESSATTSASTELNATLTKVIEASMNAAAITESAAQLTIAVNAETNAIATTSADATLSYTVNAELNATAQTTVDAQITRIISAEMTATAQTSVEAGIGVTFVSSLMAAGSVTNAELFRTATLESSLTANGTTTSAITTAKNVAASVTGAATVTSANLTVIDVDAAAFFARVTNAGGSLTSTEQSAINTLVLDLKTNSIWTKMQAIYPMVGSSAAACAQNLKSSSYTGTFGGAITYSANGITSNGTTGYLDTGFNPSLHNSAGSSHLSYYSRTSVTESKVDIGCYGTGYTNPNQLAIHFNAGSSYYNPNNTSDSVVKINESSSQGLFIASRTSSTSIFGKRNNNTETTGTASEARNNVKIFILAASINNNAEFFNTKQCAFASIGDGLTTTDASNLYTVVQTFQTTLSRQV